MRTDQLRPLPELLRTAAGRGGIAFADVRREVTHTELAARTERLAGHLADLGVRPADRVAILLDGVAGVESVLAAVRAGAVAVPLDSTVDNAELARLLADAGANTVITDAAGAARVSPRTLIVAGPYAGPALDYEILATTTPVSSARDSVDLDGPAFLCYTAGVTGPPRGVLTTQRNVLWAALGAYADVLSHRDRLLWTLPLHCEVAHLFAALVSGASVGLAADLNSTEVRHALAEQQSTVLAANAMMFADLPNLTESVRFGLLVGTGHANSRFPLLTVYTITETAGPVAMSRPGDHGLVPLPGIRIRLADDGEVLVSGPTVPDGWYHTGDLGVRDDMDRLTITGRVADQVRVGSEFVRLEQVDAALRSVPGVRDAAIAHGPVAYVVADGVAAADLFAACRALLPAAAVPAELYAVRAIPRTPTGSPLRHRLPGLPARLLGVAAATHETLFAQHWEPLPPPASAPSEWAVAGPPELTAGLDVPAFVIDSHTDVDTLSDLVTSWLAEHTGTRLVLLTHGAVHAGGYAPDPARAAAWGLGRAQQLRHPGRLVLVDADALTEELLAAAVASGADELAVRAGELLRPHHVPVPASSAGPPLTGTVLLVSDRPDLADHLVAAHDVRELIVAGPTSAPDVPGAEVVANALDALAERLVDGVVGVDLTAAEALALHEATLAHNLSAFVLLNSGADASACAVADALVRHRRILELPAVSVTWTHPGFTELPRSWRTSMVDAALAVAEPCLVAGVRAERTPVATDVQGVVTAELVAVLGKEVSADVPFQELGLDWPATVRLRTRLSVATGLDLPTTFTSDHPTPAALVAHLRTLLGVAPTPKRVARQAKPIRHLARVGGIPVLPPTSPTVPWLLSASSPRALREEAAWLASLDLDIAELGLALADRPALPCRAAVTGTTRAELVEALAAITPSTVSAAPTAFLFTGQGAQRVGMGTGLSARFPVFRQVFAEVCEVLNPYLPTPLNDVLNTDALHDTEFAQPALFAVEVALFRLLESWGVRPDYVAGHGVGEFAAAHVAGVLSLPDAALLVASRGRLTVGGTMVSVQATEAEVAPLLSPRMSIAAINGPTALVLSGESAATLAAAEELADRGRKTRRLAVAHAFHSPLMAPMLPRFQAIAETIHHATPQIPLVSTLTGVETHPTPAYWAKQARSTVRFTAAMATLAGRGVETYVELGPDAVLSRMTRDCLPHATAIPTMSGKHPETRTIAEAFGHLFTRGSTMDGQTFFPGTARITLPTDVPHRRSA